MTAPLTRVERDPAFRLSDEDREQLRRGFDLDALERLLSHVAPEHRARILAAFRIPHGNNRVAELWHLADADLQSLLEEVWAPYWRHMPLDVIAADESGRPGKQVAMARRQNDPLPQDVVLGILAALDARRGDEAFRWIIPEPTTSGADLLAAATDDPAVVKRTVVAVVPEGDAVAHILYREDSRPVRVSTVYRTSEGWRVRLDELLAQLHQSHS